MCLRFRLRQDERFRQALRRPKRNGPPEPSSDQTASNAPGYLRLLTCRPSCNPRNMCLLYLATYASMHMDLSQCDSSPTRNRNKQRDASAQHPPESVEVYNRRSLSFTKSLRRNSAAPPSRLAAVPMSHIFLYRHRFLSHIIETVGLLSSPLRKKKGRVRRTFICWQPP